MEIIFTGHAKDRIKKRKISEEEIIEECKKIRKEVYEEIYGEKPDTSLP